MPRLATDVAGQTVQPAKPSMQENQQHSSVDLFVGVDVGKGHHHAVALDRRGKRLYKKALPTMRPSCPPSLPDSRRTASSCSSSISLPPSARCSVPVARAEGVLVAYQPGLARRIADLPTGEAKTDARDAAIITAAARSMPHTLRSLRVADCCASTRRESLILLTRHSRRTTRRTHHAVWLRR